MTRTFDRTSCRIINAGPWTGWPSRHFHTLSRTAVRDVVISINGTRSVQMIMPDGISQFCISHIGDDRLVVSLEFWTVSAWSEQLRATKQLQEYPLEFPTEYYVDDEVDAAVDRYEKVACLYQPKWRIVEESLVNVRGEWQDVADEENDHYAKQHCR